MLTRIIRRLLCRVGWHRWSPIDIPDISASGRDITRTGRHCVRCWRVEWVPYGWFETFYLRPDWQPLDLAQHYADIERRRRAEPHP